MGRVRRIGVVGFAAVVAGALGCAPSGARPTATLGAADSADQVLEGFAHYATSEGVRHHRIEADTALFFEATQSLALRGLRVTFYDANGVERSRLAADRGVYRWRDGTMEAMDHVVLLTPDSGRLETEFLRFDNTAHQISTDRPFRFVRGDERIRGTSFRSDPDFKHVVTDQPRGVAGQGILLPGQRE